jgi:hypothetical protein
VKKVTACIFLSIYLFSVTELRQLIKFPLLVQHYLEHKAENKSLTLLEFLRIHYHDETIMDADYAKDMQLPFKSHDACHCISFNAHTFQLFATVIEKPVRILPVKHIICNDVFINSVYLSAVWQPPRFVIS